MKRKRITKMDKNTKAIEELRKSLNEQKKENKRNILLEMIYNDEYEQDEDTPGYESVPELPHEEAKEGEAYGEKEQNTQNAQDNQASQNDGGIDPQIMDLFANIRHAVLDGLQHFEKKPYSKEYDILSKLLKLVDQSVEFSSQTK
jgi:hypothetical protein